MKKETKTKYGFTVCRRCDNCGIRISNITADGEGQCTLKCGHCGQEYRFRRTSKGQLYAATELAHTICR